jgi:NADH:ubiquinone reductase (non-electrogenic)
MPMPSATPPTIIVGGGFTGLFAAMHLCHQGHPHPILLIDKSDRFVFKPLLYELLSGELTEQQVWPTYDDLLNCDAITFIHDAVHRIDLDRQEVVLVSGQRYSYGHLVLGLGSTVHDFGIPGVKDYAFAFRTGEDVEKLRHHLRQCLQQASQTTDPERRRALLTIAIIGAGPAGVEMAATLGDLLPQWASEFDGLVAELTIAIVNRSPDILKGDINGGLRDTVQQALQNRLVPVQLLTGTATQVEPNHLAYQHDDQGHTLSTHTIIWTTGNRVNPVIADLPLPDEHKDKAGRLRVLPTLQLPGYPTVFAGGDCTVLDDPQPPTAQVAYQQGAAIATNLSAVAQHQPPQLAQVTLRGTLIKLGLAEGAANLFDRIAITGRSGHLIRQGTYLSLLPNPVHNFNTTLSWLTDELFQRHTLPPPVPEPSLRSGLPRWAAGSALGLAVAVGGGLMWRAIAPAQFERLWQPTGIPALIDRVDE